ncbi:META domain-containing protein [Lentzea sp. BCCO 10_0856]|uniref:META domain-containing protein n=1 Tax=Lentzea miocenica TaxID=3095431 RepID=A0ABU4T603_9PSEU|nr:META domain-containing protein [Lentzea sp. BCCO 10_0856]MDX8033600.1 META domain-containing protein [Lentzea sp. BCCO 10_0856]
MSHRIALAVLLLAATSACAGGQAGQGSANLRGKVYVSSSVTEQGKPRALVEGTKVDLRFTDDDRLIANVGCNMMQGQVSLDGGKLSVADLSSTAMGCPKPELHQQDEWFAKLLDAKPSWKLDGANLVLTGSDTEIVLGTEAPATLEGGTWTVDGIIAGDAVSSFPGGAKATFVFQDGNMKVDTGCNYKDAAYPYEVDGQRLVAQMAVTTLIRCGDDMNSVETAIHKTLDSGEVTYKIDRNSLTLTNASGAGLTLKK